MSPSMFYYKFAFSTVAFKNPSDYLRSYVDKMNNTFGTCKMIPKALNVSYKSFSSTSGSKLPMKRLAPMSRFFW